MPVSCRLIPTQALRLGMRTDPVVISHAIMEKCAAYIRESANTDGYFSGEFLIEEEGGEAILFDIFCRIGYGYDFTGARVAGVCFFYASAFTCDEEGNPLPTDFTEGELEDYLKG